MELSKMELAAVSAADRRIFDVLFTFAEKTKRKGSFSFTYYGLYNDNDSCWYDGLNKTTGPDVTLDISWFKRDSNVGQVYKPTDKDEKLRYSLLNQILPLLFEINSFKKPRRVIIECENAHSYCKLNGISYIILRLGKLLGMDLHPKEFKFKMRVI